MDALPLADIQAFILHTYKPCALRVFVLKVDDARSARAFLGGMAGADASAPQLATAEQWREQHSYRVNVGITYEGLAALGVPGSSLATFPREFVGGSVGAAERVGDTGESAPDKWHAPFAGAGVHLLLFLFVIDKAATEAIVATVSARLRAAFSAGRACRELSVRDARSLPGDVAHFGYRDGFAQPAIEGGPPPLIPDILPQVPASEFLLGYENYTTDKVPAPAELCRNGSYAALRILEQDCGAFEAFLTEQAGRTGLTAELIAAKLCGRWRSGAPLTLFPAMDDKDHTDPKSFSAYNSFDYVKTDKYGAEGYDDSSGAVCPIGSHIRRMNPRHSDVAGDGLGHRIVRRGLPYGPPYDPANPKDGIERGLLGLFIGASLQNQFEFLMKHWANDGQFAPGLGKAKDPILGDHTASGSKFEIPSRRGKPVVLSGMPRFVTTRGSAYCFVPSMTAVRYLASLQ